MLRTTLLLCLAAGLYVTADMTYTMAMTDNPTNFGGYLGFLGPVMCVTFAFALGLVYPRDDVNYDGSKLP
jgi:hypothetical protein